MRTTKATTKKKRSARRAASPATTSPPTTATGSFVARDAHEEAARALSARLDSYNLGSSIRKAEHVLGMVGGLDALISSIAANELGDLRDTILHLLIFVTSTARELADDLREADHLMGQEQIQLERAARAAGE